MRLVAALTIGCSLLLSLPCVADEAADQYAHAKKLYNEGRHELALPLFREALDRSGSPNARLFVARCLRESGDLVGAYEQFTKTLEDARVRAASEPKYKPTRDAAAAELARLEERVGRVVVALPEGVTAKSVTIGERAVDDLHDPTPVMPGEVSIAVEAEGYEPAIKHVSVGAGSLETVVIELEPLVATAPTTPPPEPRGEDTSPGLGTWRTIGIVVAGVGLGGLVMGGVTGAMARSKESQLDEECGGQRCTDPSYADVVDDGQTLATIANVGFFAGGGLLAAGATMIIFGGPSDAAEAEATLRPDLLVAPGSVYAGVGGSF
jgi:hypothetical protein